MTMEFKPNVGNKSKTDETKQQDSPGTSKIRKLVLAAFLSDGPEATVAATTEVLKLLPDDTQMLIRRSRAYIQLGQISLAKVDAERASKIDSSAGEIELAIIKKAELRVRKGG